MAQGFTSSLTISISIPTSSTATETIVSVNNTGGGTEILAANADRKWGQLRVSINATQGVYIARGSSASSFSRYYAPGDIITLADGAIRYTGAVFGYVTSGTVDVEATEIA